MRSRPDVLVLGAGGVLGEAWMMGLLAGIEDASGFDLRDCEHFVGTSAGAIVAAHLVAGDSPRRPSAIGTELELSASQPAGRRWSRWAPLAAPVRWRSPPGPPSHRWRSERPRPAERWCAGRCCAGCPDPTIRSTA